MQHSDFIEPSHTVPDVARRVGIWCFGFLRFASVGGFALLVEPADDMRPGRNIQQFLAPVGFPGECGSGLAIDLHRKQVV